jgi:hypothetical protein
MPARKASEGDAVDSRRIDLQIRAIVVTYRIERRRRDSLVMEEFRARARSLLDSLEDEARGHPNLEAQLFEARQEVDADESPSTSDRRST